MYPIRLSTCYLLLSHIMSSLVQYSKSHFIVTLDAIKLSNSGYYRSVGTLLCWAIYCHLYIRVADYLWLRSPRLHDTHQFERWTGHSRMVYLATRLLVALAVLVSLICLLVLCGFLLFYSPLLYSPLSVECRYETPHLWCLDDAQDCLWHMMRPLAVWSWLFWPLTMEPWRWAEFAEVDQSWLESSFLGCWECLSWTSMPAENDLSWIAVFPRELFTFLDHICAPICDAYLCVYV